MKYIGEIAKNSSILLEIVIKDEDNNLIELDNPVEASINKLNSDGVTNIDNVILNTLGDVYQYQYSLSDFEEGMYEVVYKIDIDGKIIEEKETFYVKENEETKEVEDEEAYGDKLDFVLPHEFQTESEIEVYENEIHITIPEGFQPNQLYTVIVNKNIESISGIKLDEPVAISFSTEYMPLYATPLEIKSLMKDTFFYFEIKDVYEAIRDASQKAHQMLRMAIDPNSQDFELIEQDSEQYYPATKYVAYQAAIQLLNKLIVKIIYDKENSSSSLLNADVLTGGFTLGDFSVTQKDGDTKNVKAEELPEISVVKELIESNEKELKFWQDAMMGRNARGYASPLSAISRGAVINPESRDI